jgi:hypothetical protein
MQFGDFSWLCHNTPSYPWCNLFYRQMQDRKETSVLAGLSRNANSAPVGINPHCGTLKLGSDGSLGNISNIIVCAISILVVLALIFMAHRRKAAVGRSELQVFLVFYLISLPLQLITTGSLLEQGSTALVALTAVHAAIVAALFWSLLANALIATQVVEDGTPSSLIPFGIISALIFAGTLYIALDVGLGFTSTLQSDVPAGLHSIPLFVLTSIWPAAAFVIYFVMMTYIVLGVLNEIRPMWFYVISGILFVLSQLAYFLLGKVVCDGTHAKIDGSFIATILETAAAGVLFLAWKSITEESWDEDPYYPNYS